MVTIAYPIWCVCGREGRLGGMGRPLRTVMLLLLCALASGCTRTDGLRWTAVQADPFSLRVDYPANLFPGGSRSRGRQDLQWIFGPYPDGTSLMLQASRITGEPDAYEAACTLSCPGETFHLKSESVGISTGQIGTRVYYSKCVRSRQEMHCLHVIYPVVKRAVFASVVTRMGETLR